MRFTKWTEERIMFCGRQLSALIDSRAFGVTPHLLVNTLPLSRDWLLLGVCPRWQSFSKREFSKFGCLRISSLHFQIPDAILLLLIQSGIECDCISRGQGIIIWDKKIGNVFSDSTDLPFFLSPFLPAPLLFLLSFFPFHSFVHSLYPMTKNLKILFGTCV